MQQTIAAASALAMIGLGCWIERPSSALIVVGVILLAGIVYARTRT